MREVQGRARLLEQRLQRDCELAQRIVLLEPVAVHHLWGKVWKGVERGGSAVGKEAAASEGCESAQACVQSAGMLCASSVVQGAASEGASDVASEGALWVQGAACHLERERPSEVVAQHALDAQRLVPHRLERLRNHLMAIK